MKYRPEIDGLRAIAVVAVILYHAGYSTFSGGFIGVDVFFVISGFLITRIIVSELEKGTFSIINFYERRARRILPMLFFIMAITIPVAWIILLPSNMKSFADSLIAVSTFSSNFLFWSESGYWDTASSLKPLLHTWSLAVEEQFYIVFPILLIITASLKKKWIIIIVLLLSFLSLIIAQWGATNLKSANFFLIPSRIWELAIGAIIAQVYVYYNSFYLKITSSKIINDTFSLIGLILILVPIFTFNKNTPFPSIYTLAPTIGSGLVILFTTSETIVGRLLILKPIVLTGLISYSAYLWHQPIFAFINYIAFPKPSPSTILIITLLILPLSYLSWKFIEAPFRNKNQFNRNRIFKLWIFGSLFYISFGLFGHYTKGFNSRNSITELSVKNYVADNSILREKSWEIIRGITEKDYFITNNISDNRLWFNKKDKRKKILIVGNSHSKDLFNTLSFSEKSKAKFQIARYGAQIRVLSDINHEMFSSPNYTDTDIIMICSRYNKKDKESFNFIIQKLLSDNKQVVIVKNIFRFLDSGVKTIADFHVQKMLSNKYEVNDSIIKLTTNRINTEYYQKYSEGRKNVNFSDTIFKTLSSKYENIIILDRMKYVCEDSNQKCFAINNLLEKYFYDDAHNTLEGAKFMGKRIDEVDWLREL